MIAATENSRLALIDWMKAAGLALIVFGHVSSYLDHVVPPIYPKQLGVAFVLFVTGYSLATERRGSLRVVFNRLFEIVLIGLACAGLMSATSLWQSGRGALSNYLPFLLGINVLTNEFPTNPTTWFIGTYIHVLLLWAVALRRLKVELWMLACVCLAEIAARTLLREFAGQFIAYMAFSNWATVFLLGLYCGQRNMATTPVPAAGPWLALAAFAVGWPLAWSAVSKEPSFPFMTFHLGSPIASSLAASAATTTLYVGYTALAFGAFRSLPNLAIVRFFAQNSLVIFVAHMPVMYLILEPIARLNQPAWVNVSLRFFVCFVLLAAVSQVVRAVVNPVALREAVWRWLAGRWSAVSARPALQDLSH